MSERSCLVTGIVTGSNDYKDNDKILTLFTLERGSLSATAKGCKKTGASLCAAAQLFSYGTYQLYEKSGRLTVTQAQIKHSFYDLSGGIEKFGVAQFMGALLCALEVEDSRPHFALLLHLLNYLEKGELTPQQALLVFCLKLSDLYGVRPNLECCCGCGNQTNRFHLEHGGLLCPRCAPGGVALSQEQLGGMRTLLCTKNGDLAAWASPQNDGLPKLLTDYLMYHLEIPPYHRKFLQKIGML